jgi:hypothetical protein
MALAKKGTFMKKFKLVSAEKHIEKLVKQVTEQIDKDAFRQLQKRMEAALANPCGAGAVDDYLIENEKKK